MGRSWRLLVGLLILLALSSCGHRTPPTELVRLHEGKKPTKVVPLHTEVIVVDAGHGGKDTGTMSKQDAYVEKELTLQMAAYLCDCLHQLGYKTVMTRSQDVFVELDERAHFANQREADLFVSVHCNHSVNREAAGVEVYYYKENKPTPSARIQASKLLGGEVLRKILGHTGAASRGLKQQNFAVIRETKMPAILIETGFLSNPQERTRLRDPHYQRALAWGIARGIDSYLKK